MREVKCDIVGGQSRGKYFLFVFKYRENMTIKRRNRWKRTSMSITASLTLPSSKTAGGHQRRISLISISSTSAVSPFVLSLF